MQVQRQSLAAQVSAVVLDRIAGGHWGIGTKLPGEASLAAELGVGRSTVREAIRDLAGRGVLDTRQGAGVFVAAAAPRQEWPKVLHQAAIGEVVEGRLAVETEAAHRAAHRRTSADLESIDNALARRASSEALADNATFVDADLEFHHAVVRAAHNQVLEVLFASFRARVRAAILDMLTLLGEHDSRPRQVHDAHAAILAAIRDRDGELAATHSRTHLEELHQQVLDTPSEHTTSQ